MKPLRDTVAVYGLGPLTLLTPLKLDAVFFDRSSVRPSLLGRRVSLLGCELDVSSRRRRAGAQEPRRDGGTLHCWHASRPRSNSRLFFFELGGHTSDVSLSVPQTSRTPAAPARAPPRPSRREKGE